MAVSIPSSSVSDSMSNEKYKSSDLVCTQKHSSFSVTEAGANDELLISSTV